MNHNEALVRVVDLKKFFPVRKGVLFRKELGQVHAVNGITFDVPRGASFGLVGESGCGKTTVAKLLLRIEAPTSGEVYYDGKEIFHQSPEEELQYLRAISIVFQDPFSSLSPRMQLWETITEPLRISGHRSKRKYKERAAELLKTVGLDPRHIESYPHRFSGGQRQRIAIARALSSSPQFMVLDEPVSGLDVSIRAQIMNLLKDLQADLGLTMFLISHDLPGVRYLADVIGVMYLGELVEMGNADQVYNNPLHPYTKVLLSSIPMPFEEDRERHERIKITGEVPSPLNPPSGCRFHTRCPFAMPICSEVAPESKETEVGHKVSCHLY
ncbi:MAG: ATP-binding cassette domain-containing protein [Chloroflexi bacterium]|nr:ATP-binding cassette domain-containing protein [Chloroflexota bacterium]